MKQQYKSDCHNADMYEDMPALSLSRNPICRQCNVRCTPIPVVQDIAPLESMADIVSNPENIKRAAEESNKAQREAVGLSAKSDCACGQPWNPLALHTKEKCESRKTAEKCGALIHASGLWCANELPCPLESHNPSRKSAYPECDKGACDGKHAPHIIHHHSKPSKPSPEPSGWEKAFLSQFFGKEKSLTYAIDSWVDEMEDHSDRKEYIDSIKAELISFIAEVERKAEERGEANGYGTATKDWPAMTSAIDANARAKERKTIYTDLIAIADQGEIESMRFWMEKYFFKDEFTKPHE